ncbi:putative ribonuclease H-like domain-containing protein [Tanacetum coccineum]
MPDLEDTADLQDTGIFKSAYDDEYVGAEADLTNLETNMSVSPIPTTRIHKDHPKAQIIGEMEPKKVTQALDDESWVEAMQEELLQFKLLNVWTLVNLPHGKKAIGTKWVFRNKRDQRGIVVRNKARLVAQGYRQEEGVDYDDVFAPVARIEAIRLFLAFASFMGFTVYQMEVEKALYGLHQAPRAWYETLSTYLLENGFRRGTIDKTLFIKKIKNDILLVQVYVDDIIFGSTKESLSTEFEQLMHKRFQMSSMGELTFFLGLQVEQRKDGIFLSQDKYVYDILKKFGFSSVKTASTPMETHKPLSQDTAGTDVDVHLYRSMIGSLMYLTSSRPDIMFAVCAINYFQLSDSHLLILKCSETCMVKNLLKGYTYQNSSIHCLNKITQEVLNAAAGGSSNSDTDKIMARMDAMTMKMDAQYKELQSRVKQPTPNLNNDDIPMSREEEAKFMQTFLPPKLGDLGSFLIPCNFKTFSCNALTDLGASINLTPYSLYAKLSLETLKPTKMSVRLADRTFQYPVGIAENMLVEVGKFTFPVDFIILEMEEDSKVPLILGRPFLHTADAVI